jgi:hypothetical protein
VFGAEPVLELEGRTLDWPDGCESNVSPVFLKNKFSKKTGDRLFLSIDRVGPHMC